MRAATLNPDLHRLESHSLSVFDRTLVSAKNQPSASLFSMNCDILFTFQNFVTH